MKKLFICSVGLLLKDFRPMFAYAVDAKRAEADVERKFINDYLDPDLDVVVAGIRRARRHKCHARRKAPQRVPELSGPFLYVRPRSLENTH